MVCCSNDLTDQLAKYFLDEAPVPSTKPKNIYLATSLSLNGVDFSHNNTKLAEELAEKFPGMVYLQDTVLRDVVDMFRKTVRGAQKIRIEDVDLSRMTTFIVRKILSRGYGVIIDNYIYDYSGEELQRIAKDMNIDFNIHKNGEDSV